MNQEEEEEGRRGEGKEVGGEGGNFIGWRYRHFGEEEERKRKTS